MKIRKPQQIRSEILNEAEAYGRGEGDAEWRLIKIKELVTELDYQISRQKRFTVTNHAVKQFMLRSKCKDEESAKGTLLTMVTNSVQMEVIERYRAIQLINHNFKDAEYFRYGNWLLVVCGDSIVTCHNATAKRWREINESVAT